VVLLEVSSFTTLLFPPRHKGRSWIPPIFIPQAEGARSLPLARPSSFTDPWIFPLSDSLATPSPIHAFSIFALENRGQHVSKVSPPSLYLFEDASRVLLPCFFVSSAKVSIICGCIAFIYARHHPSGSRPPQMFFPNFLLILPVKRLRQLLVGTSLLPLPASENRLEIAISLPSIADEPPPEMVNESLPLFFRHVY